MTPAFCPAPGVSVTRPATSRNASALPAVPTGTSSLTWSTACSPPGTVTDAELNDTECGEPAALAWATPNVIAELPWFRIVMCFCFE